MRVRHMAPRWLVELLIEARANEWRERVEERHELRALRGALERLQDEIPAEHQAVVDLLRPGRALIQREDEPAVTAGLRKLAAWVDGEMENA